jgi:feruloyl esterase
MQVMVDWAENGVTPDTIVGKAGAETPWPGRSRPLCPYPQVTTYNGKGATEQASSFACR